MNADQVLAGAQDALTVRRVIGDPIQADGSTIIPVAMLCGGGGGGGRVNESGAGFGIMARPLGVFNVRNGQVSWTPAVDVNAVVLGAQLVAIAALVTLGPTVVRWVVSRRAAQVGGNAPFPTD